MAEEATTGTVETLQDEVKSEADHVALWLEAIELAGKNEKKWRESANSSYELYRASKENKSRVYNVFYSNVQTIVAASYNSPPVPDIRERYMTGDIQGKNIANTLERAVNYSIDSYDVDTVLEGVVLDATITGRGVPRVRYEPILVPNKDYAAQLEQALLQAGPEVASNPALMEQISASIPKEVVGYQKVCFETVQWDDLRIGPAKVWKDVPWVAFRHLMTRDQLIALSPKYGPLVNLDQSVNGADKDKSDQVKEIFKRAEVWEVWNRDGKEKYFIASSYKSNFLFKGAPEFNLDDFFPIPRPLYSIYTPNSLEPVDPYRYYKDLAEELNDITIRIGKLVKVLKWRGVTADELKIAEALKDADDGEIVPAENTTAFVSQGKGFDNAIWFMPIDKLIAVIRELYSQREQIKQAIYEIMGISDIIRGSSKATETLGAQQLKAQWGSIRITRFQKGVERIARDIVRMMVEILAEKFEPEVLQLMTGTMLSLEEISLMRNDILRTYKIDVESDSTIRADLSRSQQNISQFITGLGQFISAIGPAVQTGAFPPDVALTMLVSFSRYFKLGKQVEDALDNLLQKAQAMAQQQAQQIPQQVPQQAMA